MLFVAADKSEQLVGEVAFNVEIERVARAWNYVYQNGCKGKKSPF